MDSGETPLHREHVLLILLLCRGKSFVNIVKTASLKYAWRGYPLGKLNMDVGLLIMNVKNCVWP